MQVMQQEEIAVQEKILVVDDGQDMLDFVVEHVLQPAGYHYVLAHDGREGLKMAVQHQPDLILLDFHMPRMNGAQLLEQLNRNNIDIPVILMTSKGSEDIAIEVYRLGVKDYVRKPFYPEEMLEAIEYALAETRLRKEKEALTRRILRANQELQHRVQQLHTLYEVGKNVTSIIDMKDLLPRIVEAATRISHAEEGQLSLLIDGRLCCRAEVNQTMHHARSCDKVVNDSIARHVIQTQSALLLGPEQLRKQEAQPIAMAYAPLIMKGNVMGVLSVANYTASSREFNPGDRELLEALSDYAAVAIQNSRHYHELEASKQQVQATFERFVPPSVVQQALARPEGVELGGHRQEISVLFADIRGYTAWSENAAPEQVMETLNHYLNLAAGVVIGWNGTLDKFMGDGLMAIFNAPNAMENHVHYATEAALAMMHAAHEVNAQHGYKLSYSIGVNVGEAVVGYIGNKDAMNYTAIGDTVNLAKRLQEYAKPGQILIDESVAKRLGKLIKAKPLAKMRVKGRQQPTIAYELIDLRPMR
ncbi:response regulator [Phototrophicus methaneseepsis]|uniref:Response regulator n=1 Tax=Phototrophicus methaneseepsis TaxID=2710758 RepID=A0A7S8IDV4_9CHLR|nr:adenylate/guanylate cyclase domain-containing protein [Phototrophicus methaneseepsis]QPC81749.1 response regulator [Phototrophicus methaneseepsis]